MKSSLDTQLKCAVSNAQPSAVSGGLQQHLRRISISLDLKVRAEQRHARLQLPHVQICHRTDSLNLQGSYRNCSTHGVSDNVRQGAR